VSDTSTIFDLTYTDNHGNEVSLAQYRGQPLLIVNTASKCGFTPQYQGLQELHGKYADRGLVVIGFPCDQFAHQEPGDDAQIASFCQLNYGVTFPLSTKVDVNGSGTHPVFTFLKERSGGLLGSAIKWNFTKFLIAPDGQTVQRYAPKTEPAKMEGDIITLLDQRASE
jgi:glutathione peroxidase